MSNDIQLGFGPSPRPQYVYLDADTDPNGWYFFDHASESRVPIEEAALTGELVKVETTEKEFRGKTNPKVQFHVSAGPRNYIIETGRYTAFARCMLAALSRMGAENISRPITIEPQRGDEKAVFANVYNPVNGGRVPYAYPKTEEDVEGLLDAVMGFFQSDAPVEAAAS